ncbi:MAG: diguanylate cyclase [Myxococcales bacterium]|nr:diguanylate cyclase [Myxococcales bacterium]MCB9644294.1 diguanylate cyclase [Myxococcales bacterium]
MRSYSSTLRPQPYQRIFTLMAAAGLLLLVLSGTLDKPSPRLETILPLMGVFVCWLSWEMYRGIVRFWLERGEEPSYEAWQGLGFALLAGIMILLRLTGGLYSPFYPLFYLSIAFLASFGTSSQGGLWFGYAMLLEIAAVLGGGVPHSTDVGRGALHLVYLGLFGISHHLCLHGLLWSVQRHRSNLRRVREQRHHSAPPFPTEEAMALGMTEISLEALEQERTSLLSMLREGLDAHGCALVWLGNDEKTYVLAGIDTNAPHIDDGPFSIHQGMLANVFKNQTNLRISRSGENGLHLPYYTRHTVVRAMLSVPIRQGDQIRGALCADRIRPVPFSPREETMLQAAAMLYSRMLQSERSYRRSDRANQHLHMLHDMGQRLNRANTERSLATLALEAASCFAQFDWGFVSRVEADQRHHTVLATTESIHHLLDQKLHLGPSLLALALKHGCPLPEGGHLRSQGPFLAQPDPDNLPEIGSLYMLPLILHDQSIGVIALGARDPQTFANEETEKNLGALANHVAPLLSHLQNFARMEYLAARDGLTGLYNHRTMMERSHTMFEAARRFKRPLSVMMMDIDHFKQLNDTYGHPVGDRVLHHVAGVLQSSVREIDLAARYGGEEFAVLLEETDVKGALQLADRLRKQIAELDFCSDGNDPEVFCITISVGVASFPAHATDVNGLFKAADEALYKAKHNGRNRVQLYIPEKPLESPALQDDLPKISPTQAGWGWGSLPPQESAESISDVARWGWYDSKDGEDPHFSAQSLPLETPSPDNDDDGGNGSPPSNPGEGLRI